MGYLPQWMRNIKRTVTTRCSEELVSLLTHAAAVILGIRENQRSAS